MSFAKTKEALAAILDACEDVKAAGHDCYTMSEGCRLRLMKFSVTCERRVKNGGWCYSSSARYSEVNVTETNLYHQVYVGTDRFLLEKP